MCVLTKIISAANKTQTNCQILLDWLTLVNVQRRQCMPLRPVFGDIPVPVPPPTYTTSIGASFLSSASSSEKIQ